MNLLDWWQLLANVVTFFGLPAAIFTFVLEQRKERENAGEEVYQQLSDAYTDFLKLVLKHSDLKLRTQTSTSTRAMSGRRSSPKFLFRFSNGPIC